MTLVNNKANFPRTAQALVANFVGRARRVFHEGREWYVAPLTLIVPGVLSGSKGALFYPHEELALNFKAWDGMPMVLYHPEKDGQAISAQTPGIFEKFGLGFVRNSRMKDKLTAEGWFDIAAVERIRPEILVNLEAGIPIELSTGLFTDNIPEEGNYRGRDYTHVARNYRPDHLAILPDQVGACSLNDGCGVLINRLAANGGPGSGNFGHAGRPGMRGGSAGKTGGGKGSTSGKGKGNATSKAPKEKGPKKGTMPNQKEFERAEDRYAKSLGFKDRHALGKFVEAAKAQEKRDKEDNLYPFVQRDTGPDAVHTMTDEDFENEGAEWAQMVEDEPADVGDAVEPIMDADEVEQEPIWDDDEEEPVVPAPTTKQPRADTRTVADLDKELEPVETQAKYLKATLPSRLTRWLRNLFTGNQRGLVDDEDFVNLLLNGGPGSGNFGHGGRPGQRGGSSSGGGGGDAPKAAAKASSKAPKLGYKEYRDAAKVAKSAKSSAAEKAAAHRTMSEHHQEAARLERRMGSEGLAQKHEDAMLAHDAAAESFGDDSEVSLEGDTESNDDEGFDGPGQSVEHRAEDQLNRIFKLTQGKDGANAYTDEVQQLTDEEIADYAHMSDEQIEQEFADKYGDVATDEYNAQQEEEEFPGGIRVDTSDTGKWVMGENGVEWKPDPGTPTAKKLEQEKDRFSSVRPPEPGERTALDEANSQAAQKLEKRLESLKSQAANPLAHGFNPKTKAGYAKEIKKVEKQLKKLKPPTKNRSQDMPKLTANQREEMVTYITTNCDCWKEKGDIKVLNSFSDEKLAALKGRVEKEALKVAVANAAKAGASELEAGDKVRMKKKPTGNSNGLAGKHNSNKNDPLAANEDDEEDEEMEDEEASDEGDEDDAEEDEEAPPKKPPFIKNSKGTNMTPEQWLKTTDAPSEVKELVENSVRAQKNERKGLIKKITANENYDAEDFPAETLQTMSLNALRRMVKMMGDDPEPIYVGAAIGERPLTNKEATEDLLEPTPDIDWAEVAKSR